MRILITGANGQLGREFKKACNKHKLKAVSKAEMDITNKLDVENVIRKFMPDLIIHSAAYTAVDQCEEAVNKAFEVNSMGTLNVAVMAKEIGAELIYFSSDYVFDGKKKTPYEEDDETNPLNIYGESKLIGEQIVKNIQPKSYIIRTSWLYGFDAHNFVYKMIKLARNKTKLTVVSDQIGTPTFTKDLVSYTLQLFQKPYGIYHISNSGSCSWFEFAKKIFVFLGYNSNLITPVTTEEYGARASRPAYSVLKHKRLTEISFESPRHWEVALHEFLKEGFND